MRVIEGVDRGTVDDFDLGQGFDQLKELSAPTCCRDAVVVRTIGSFSAFAAKFWRSAMMMDALVLLIE